MADTGSGATLGLSVSMGAGTIANVRSLTLPTFMVEDIETSILATTNFKTFVASDLTDAGEIVAEILFDPTQATATALPARSVAEVVTVTWPIHTSGNTTNATFVADGYIKSVDLPNMSVGELQVSTVTIKLNGEDTEPAFSAEAA